MPGETFVDARRSTARLSKILLSLTVIGTRVMNRDKHFAVVRDIPELDLDQGDVTLCASEEHFEDTLRRHVESGALVELGWFRTPLDVLDGLDYTPGDLIEVVMRKGPDGFDWTAQLICSWGACEPGTAPTAHEALQRALEMKPYVPEGDKFRTAAQKVVRLWDACLDKSAEFDDEGEAVEAILAMRPDFAKVTAAIEEMGKILALRDV